MPRRKNMIHRMIDSGIRSIAVTLLTVLALAISGCSSAPATTEGRLQIVTTTTMLYDATATIAGEHADVKALMGPGIDPHMYQASAGDVKTMQNADIVVYNGLHLEGKMGDIFASLTRQNRNVISAEEGVDPSRLLSDENNPDIHDPHIWFDVSIWKEVVTHIAEQLSIFDPEHQEDYMNNLSAYLMELDDLDSYMKQRVSELDEQQRVLVTAHDAFRYFGKAYGFEVKGLQGISTDAEAGTADVSNLAQFIANNKIKAIFVESSVPPKNIEALQAAVKAKGFAVEIGGELYSDSLGDAASGNDTYVKTCKANIDTIVDALK